MNSNLISWISSALERLPGKEQIQQLFPYISIFALIMLGLGVVGRVVLGKRSALNHAVSSAMAVLFIYVATTAIFAFRPLDLQKFLVPLPLITLTEDTLVLFPFRGTSLHLICTQILPLLILCFLVNLLDDLIPQGKTVITWFLLRFVTIALAMGLNLLTQWAFNTFLPRVLVLYAPMILLGVLVCLLLLGVLNVLLGLVLTVVNPILGAIYAFFFSNMIGKEITKAVFSTVLLALLFLVLEQLGFYQLDISASSFITYLPMTCFTMVLWYLLGHTL